MDFLRKIPLQRRAKVAGIVDMILSTAGITAASYDISFLLDPLHYDETAEYKRTNTLISLYITLGISIIRFIMGFILWIGAEKRNDRLCTQWLYASVPLWCFHLLTFILDMCFGTFVLGSTIVSALTTAIRVFVMVSVYRFIKEVQSDELLRRNSESSA